MHIQTHRAVLAGIALLSYLLGSLNFALILSKLMVRDDIRRHGSGNAGMTNMLRTYGKGPAIATAAGDFLKAVAAVVLARLISARFGGVSPLAGYLAGLFVILGHLFPVFFGFRGGKGVMVSLGVIFIIDPLVFAILAVVFIPMVFITRIVSLASVLGAILFPAVTYLVRRFQGVPPLQDTVCSCVIGVIILITHRENIVRLLDGTENRFGSKKK